MKWDFIDVFFYSAIALSGAALISIFVLKIIEKFF